MYDEILVNLLKIIKDQDKKIKELQCSNKKLEDIIKELSAAIDKAVENYRRIQCV